MSRQKPEDKVKSLCLSRLDQWQRWGVVIDYDDVSNLGRRCFRGTWTMRTKKGKRDIIALLNVEGVVWVYLIEVKAESGSWSEAQKDYSKKFEGIRNVIYEVVKSPQQIDATLDRITNRTEKSLKEW